MYMNGHSRPVAHLGGGALGRGPFRLNVLICSYVFFVAPLHGSMGDLGLAPIWPPPLRDPK